MKLRFGSTVALMNGLNNAGLNLLATKTEAGEASGLLQVRRWSDCAVLTFVCNRPIHFYGDKTASLLAIVSDEVWNYGEPTTSDQLAGFNPGTQCTDCFVPAGVKLSAVVVPKKTITAAVADSGDQQVIGALHESRALRMTPYQRQKFSSIVSRGLQSELSADEALLEFQAVARGGEHTRYSNDSMLHRAIERMAGSINDPVFNSAELAFAVHANERWIRRCFQNYGVTPMSFRRFMRLAMVARFIGTVEGLNSTPKQVAERFGFSSAKYLAELYRAHFGVGLQDQHRQQMMLF